jgi:beta-lactamase class A
MIEINYDRKIMMLDRRGVLGLSVPAVLGGMTLSASAAERRLRFNVDEALQRLARLPGTSSYKFEVGTNGKLFSAGYRSDVQMFVGSAVKTFFLLKFLQDVERGKLSESDQRPINNRIRSLSSPVFLDMTGQTTARSLLEAMITHSDNTATDSILKSVGPKRVRKLIRRIGLKSVKIPGSTRLMFSYLAGAPYGVDKGWRGMKAIMKDKFFGKPRSADNRRETMKGSADDFVEYYTRALTGEFFAEPATLTEFKRIQAMADAIPRVVPADTVAYAKGGSIEWLDFNALCLPGQMIVAGSPVTFCVTVNWDGSPDTIPVVAGELVEAMSEVLLEIAKTLAPELYS